MAVKYLRLFDPTQQFQLKGGQLNVAGRLYVHLESTDDLADLYDENGTQLTQPVILDNNGRAAGLFVDSSKVYWLDVQDQYGMSQFTIRKMTPCGGGGGATLGTTYELVSSDGSIAIDKTTEGNVTTYDLTRPDDSTELLEWIRCDGATKNSDTYTPIYADGTMEVGTKGIKVYADRYYHVTAHVRASKSTVQPYYDKVDILFRLVDDNDVETNVIRQSVIVDSSVGLVQDFEVSTDVKVEEDAELLLDILNTTVPGINWEVLNLEAHRVFSGAPAIPGGVANKPWVDQNFQEKLTAGDNITIVNNVISATAAPQEQSDWTETDTTDVSYIKHKPSTKPVVAGENVTITEGTNSFIISANANSQVQADWDENDSSDPSYIQHKPDLSEYATDSELTSGLATKQDTISDLSTIRSGAAAGATAIQPSDLATVATTGDYNDLSNKPSIPSAQVNSDWNSTSGVSEILNKPTLATVATSGAYSDLSGTPTLATVATSGSYADLSNKPTIPTVDQVYDGMSANAQSGVAVASALSGKQDTISDLNTIRTGAGLGATAVQPSDLATVATTGDYSDLLNTPPIPAAPVQSNWTESDSSSLAYIQNKPSLAAVATSGSYSDLSNTPTINNVPAVTSSDDAKVLKASYTGGVGSYSWETESGGASYTAGDGISIANNEISAKAGTGLEIADVSETTTDNLVCAAMSSRYESGNWAQDICPMTQALADAMNTSAGYAFTLVKPFDTDNIYAWPAIAKTSELLQDELQNYAFFGNYLSCRPSTDVSARRIYEVPAGTTLTLKFSERDQFSTITVADILADLSSYSLVILWNDEDTYYAAETMLSTAMTPETTATHTITTTLQDALCVRNPLPASTSADENKVLTVDSNGDPVWADSQGGTQVQSDWTESDTAAPSYIQNKPLDIGITEGTGITFTNSGTSISIGVTIPVPSFDPNSDVGKVLTITSGGVLAWVTP